MKKDLLLAFLAGALGVSLLYANPRSYQANYTDRVMTDEGDTPSGFAISCSNSAWTQIVAADDDSRSVLFQALSTSSGNVCISTVTAAGAACDDTTPGPELIPGASVTDYTSSRWNCRARSGGTAVVKGYRSLDSAD